MKFNLNNDQIKIAHERVRTSLEAELLVRLVALGINPEDFNEDTFVANDLLTSEKDIESFLNKIKEINTIINNL